MLILLFVKVPVLLVFPEATNVVAPELVTVYILIGKSLINAVVPELAFAFAGILGLTVHVKFTELGREAVVSLYVLFQLAPLAERTFM